MSSSVPYDPYIPPEETGASQSKAAALKAVCLIDTLPLEKSSYDRWFLDSINPILWNNYTNY